MPHADAGGFIFCFLRNLSSGTDKTIFFLSWYPLFQGNDPSCLREFLLPTLSQNYPSGNIGLQARIYISGNLLAYYFFKQSDGVSCYCSLDAR